MTQPNPQQQAQQPGIAIPVHQEELAIGKRIVDTGRGVRVRKSVEEVPVAIDELLQREEVTVRRVPVDRVVALADAPAPRQEGDTLIVPVVEEIVVVERRLRIKEEIHITRIQHQDRVQDTVFLKSEEVAVERFDEGSQSPPLS
jgi:uncharacterized protein (TIGR02271 family)